MTARTLDLDSLTLKSGAHDNIADGACLLEVASYLAGERWTDHPKCVSPVLGAYGRRLNDGLPDDPRQQLKAFLPAMLNTAGDGLDGARAEMARKTLMGAWLPAWLRLAELHDLAAQSEAAVDLTDQDLRDVQVKIRASTWLARTEARKDLRSKIREEMQRIGVKSAVAAGAVAGADADAVAVAAAGAVAGAGAVADAVAVAVAAAAAGAVAAAAAAAVAASDRRDSVYNAVYRAVSAHYETSDSLAHVRALRDQQQLEAVDLFGRMVAPVPA